MERKPLEPYGIAKKKGYYYPFKLCSGEPFFFVRNRDSKIVRYRQNSQACNFCMNHFNNWCGSIDNKYSLVAEVGQA